MQSARSSCSRIYAHGHRQTNTHLNVAPLLYADDICRWCEVKKYVLDEISSFFMHDLWI